MRAADVPVIGLVVRTGADDRVYDTAIVGGFLLMAVVAALGRTTVTVALVVAYLVGFSGYVVYKGYERGGEDVDRTGAPSTR